MVDGSCVHGGAEAQASSRHAERESLTSELSNAPHALHDGFEGLPRLVPALAGQSQVVQIHLYGAVHHVVHEVREVAVGGH